MYLVKLCMLCQYPYYIHIAKRELWKLGSTYLPILQDLKFCTKEAVNAAAKDHAQDGFGVLTIVHK